MFHREFYKFIRELYAFRSSFKIIFYRIPLDVTTETLSNDSPLMFLEVSQETFSKVPPTILPEVPSGRLSEVLPKALKLFLGVLSNIILVILPKVIPEFLEQLLRELF